MCSAYFGIIWYISDNPPPFCPILLRAFAIAHVGEELNSQDEQSGESEEEEEEEGPANFIICQWDKVGL